MKEQQSGITLIALVITIIVLLILAGISIGSITNKGESIIENAQEVNQQLQTESLIQKIQADLYKEKVKTGQTPNKEKLKEIIQQNDSGAIINNDDSFITSGGKEIPFHEILGWE